MAFEFAALTLLITLAGQAGDPPSLVGPTWVAVELAGMPVPADPAARQPAIEFVANGRVAGTDGCNRVSAPYTLNGERITFGPMIATRMACPGTDEVARRFAGGPRGHQRLAHRRRTARVLRRDRQAAGDLRGAASGRDAAGHCAGAACGAARVEGVRLDVAPGRPDPQRRAPRRSSTVRPRRWTCCTST